jgi:hypothetical protein
VQQRIQLLGRNLLSFVMMLALGLTVAVPRLLACSPVTMGNRTYYTPPNDLEGGTLRLAFMAIFPQMLRYHSRITNDHGLCRRSTLCVLAGSDVIVPCISMSQPKQSDLTSGAARVFRSPHARHARQVCIIKLNAAVLTVPL